jgi:asparagine synthase (glutamine-hydrolysing)
MDGIFGWVGEAATHEDWLQRMRHAARLAAQSTAQIQSTTAWGLGAASRFDKASYRIQGGLAVAVYGRPDFVDPALATIAREHDAAEAVAQGWQRLGATLPTKLSGSFALAILAPGQAFLAIDRIGTERLCYAHRDGELVFGTSVQSVAAHPRIGRNIDPQAIYDYLYFHTIPSPRTLYRGIAKLQPGEFVHLDQGQLRRGYYWQADFSAETPASFDHAKRAFRDRLDAAVRTADGGAQTAAFLSGGTDSSTIVGALTGVRGGAVDTFSIGFDAQGFDEMEYARCAAERFASKSHEYYLKPADIVSAIPLIAQTYDEPFGNDSAVPTWFCAKAAAEAGFTRMLAGDGGDEIFGGNARYAKQKLFEAYFRLPAALRRGLIEPLTHLPLLGAHFPLQKLRSYVDQANLRLPLRLESYNFLHRNPLAEILEPDFLHAVDPALAERMLSDEYSRSEGTHFINRLMHLDLKFTLADNDLRKVGAMTEAAGIEVCYPLLDDRLVEFANHLPVDYKVRGQRLRWFFKEALTDLLPEKIINKTKHGFGLPFGVWCNQYAPLGELVGDSLSDLGRRGWVKPAYLNEMLRMQHGEHASYYGIMIWVTMMLEQWLVANSH